MEQYSNYSYNIADDKFTKWFFKVLIFITLSVLILFISLKINDSVSISEGEIIAKDPQIDFIAPFDVQIKSILVNEGQRVAQNDTLLVLENLELEDQKAKAAIGINLLAEKIQSISELIQAKSRKLNALQNGQNLSQSEYNLNQNQLDNHLSMTKEQLSLMVGRLESTKEKFEGDSILFHKGMLSRYEYMDAKDAYLSMKEKLAELSNVSRQYAGDKMLSRNNLNKTSHQLQIAKLELEEEIAYLEQNLIDQKSQLSLTKQTYSKLEKELKMQYMIAPKDGQVNFLFNTRQSTNYILKGDMLMSLVPQSMEYYAKVNIPENHLPLIQVGQKAKLKLSAFNQFEFGALNGEVSFVGEGKENESFFALIELVKNERFALKQGYQLKGEIIQDRLPVYKFFFRKIFRNAS
ncbi:HlyD family secretion protein [Pararhodonellum marinum]|uniref:HlyD family secretion protein n=1 Tax=Pararhodonellum marinum TaxID=2755358 RepID=UPI00189069C4|nr:HlyD family efflux transporter periplasmic adaptor subunit [Pararhodonellum marinum]